MIAEGGLRPDGDMNNRFGELTFSDVFNSRADHYTIGPIVDGRLRVVDADGERWIESNKH